MKTRISIVILSIILLSVSNIASQKKVSVYLKNGSVITGRITEQYPDSILKIQSNGNIWAFKMSEVEKIDAERIQTRVTDTKGVRILADLGITGDGVSFKGTTLYRFENQLSSGLGIGFEVCDNSEFVPLFADFRYDFKPDRISPYVFTQAGYAWITNNYYYYDWYSYEDYSFAGGFHNLSGLGLKFRFEHFGFNLHLGYRMQAARETYSYIQSENPLIYAKIDRRYVYQRVELGIGLSF